MRFRAPLGCWAVQGPPIEGGAGIWKSFLGLVVLQDSKSRRDLQIRGKGKGGQNGVTRGRGDVAALSGKTGQNGVKEASLCVQVMDLRGSWSASKALRALRSSSNKQHNQAHPTFKNNNSSSSQPPLVYAMRPKLALPISKPVVNPTNPQPPTTQLTHPPTMSDCQNPPAQRRRANRHPTSPSTM